MKRVLIVAMLFSAAAYAADSAATKEAAIKSVLAKLDACVSKQEAGCLDQFFTEDATFSATFDNGKLIKGRSQIVSTLTAMAGEGGKGVEQTRTIEYVRFIGDDRALVDCSLKLSGANVTEPDASEGVWPRWHSTALMVQKDGNWLVEDVRFYFVAPPPRPTPVPTPVAIPSPPAEEEGEGGKAAEEPEAPADPGANDVPTTS